MSQTVSDHLLQRLHQWGVRRVFGYPGEGINGLMGAFDRLGSRMHFVPARHEEVAAFMACAHAKFTGEVGVCMANSGPGALHLLNGLYDAKLDHQPVVAIVGQQARAALGGDYPQEFDLLSLFKDVASEYLQMATVPEQIRHLVDRAVRIAIDQRTVTCIIVPNDLQDAAAVPEPPREQATVHTGIGMTAKRSVPSEIQIAAAATVLNAGERVAILAGAGALHATDELVQVANILGAGIAKALLGKAAVPDSLPFVTGAIGPLGTQASWEMMEHCDTLLMVGSSFPHGEYLPREGRARGVQIDTDGRRVSLRYPMEVNLIGDSRLTLQMLLPHLRRKNDRRWRGSIERNVDAWWRVVEACAMSDARPLNPQRVFWELSPRLPVDCIVTCDSGPAAYWYARDLKFRRGMMGSLSGGLGAAGCSVPYAIAAKHAHPDRHVIALAGDTALQMLGINGLAAIADGWRHWRDPRFTLMVLNNAGPRTQVQVTQPKPGRPESRQALPVLPPFAFADCARVLGLDGIRVDNPEQIGPAWDAALVSDRPTVLEMATDPDVAPTPPHVTGTQMKAYLSALLRRDPDALGIIIASAKDWWESVFLPPRDGSRRR